jgi:carbon-monoxide dehydrogenase large subunit
MPRLGTDNGELLVTGRGRYVADVALDDCVEVAFVRSPVAHAAIDAIHLGTDRAVSGSDLALRPLSLEAGGMATVLWDPMPAERVRYVGEPVAMVWGADRYEAEDTAETVSVEYAPLPTDTPIHDVAPDGVLYFRSFDSGGVDEAMEAAHLVLERTFKSARQSAVPLEGRGIVAAHDAATGVTTIWTSTQLPHLVRHGIAQTLGVDEASVRVLVPHVGGGFGLKANLYAEEIAVAALSRRLGRPVRWLEDRTENLVAATHAHDTGVSLRVAVGSDGRVLAIDADVLADIGAYSVWPATAVPEPGIAAATLFGPYAFGAIRFRARAVVSNRAPVGPCRGIGQNASVFATERMMDAIGEALRIDPVEVRRRNAVRDLPWTSPVGRQLDSGDYPALLDRLETESDYPTLRREQAVARAQGRLVGIGICLFNETSGSGSQDYRRRGVTTLPGTDATRVVVTGEGRVEIYTSAAEAGQGHADTYRALAERELGIPPGQVDVIEGDTSLCPEGSGTFISRGAVGVVESVLEALRMAAKEDLAPGTDVTHVHDPSQVYPCGAHLAVVEVDPIGLVPRVVRYVAVEDCGRVISGDLVDGQVRGGVAMGIGEVLLEEHIYSDEGQLLTASLRTYLVPLARDVPQIETHHVESPSPSTALGSKGVGEAGTIGAFGAIASAVADAVGRRGTGLAELPYSPDRIFSAIRGDEPPDRPVG